MRADISFSLCYKICIMVKTKIATEIEAPLPGKPVRGSSTGRPVMAALDLMGRRGALRVLWELREGAALTFRGLQAAAELPPGTLNARLAELRAADVVSADSGYRLTPRGADLVEALAPLLSWSQAWADDLAEDA
jgi:DNA-binding HxlR family transcriptional regulator